MHAGSCSSGPSGRVALSAARPGLLKPAATEVSVLAAWFCLTLGPNLYLLTAFLHKRSGSRCLTRSGHSLPKQERAAQISFKLSRPTSTARPTGFQPRCQLRGPGRANYTQFWVVSLVHLSVLTLLNPQIGDDLSGITHGRG